MTPTSRKREKRKGDTHLTRVGGVLTEVLSDGCLTRGANVAGGAGAGGGVPLAILLTQASVFTLELWPETQRP